jgi:hypothetical protein
MAFDTRIAVLRSFVWTAEARPVHEISMGKAAGYLDTPTIVGAVSKLDGLLLGAEFLHCANRAEDLLLNNLHVAVDIRKDSGFDEISLVTKAFSASNNSCTSLLSVLNVAHDAIELKLRNLRSLECLGIKRIADFALF